MIKIDLITGFLGAGKTTFLKKYARYLLDQGQNIGILENDFGAVNVDMMMLKDLEGDHCELEMVSGGCDADCHRRRFKTKLIAMGMCGYDRVLVEPSGIFDVDEFFDALREEPLDQWYEIGSVIAVVDAGLESEISGDEEYLLASEVADAGCVILSRSQLVSETQQKETVAHINRSMELVKCSRRFGQEIISKDWDHLTDADFEQIKNSGYVMADFAKLGFQKEAVFSSLSFLNLQIDEKKLKKIVEQLFASTEAGEVLRVKGFWQQEEQWMELNATPHSMTVGPVTAGQQVLIVIGEDLSRDVISGMIEG